MYFVSFWFLRIINKLEVFIGFNDMKFSVMTNHCTKIYIIKNWNNKSENIISMKERVRKSEILENRNPTFSSY